MKSLDEITELLRRWDVWKRVEAAPNRIDDLERRIAALEQQPHFPFCEKCGIRYLRLDRTEAPGGPFNVFAGAGLRVKIYKCDNCGMEVKKQPETS